MTTANDSPELPAEASEDPTAAGYVAQDGDDLASAPALSPQKWAKEAEMMESWASSPLLGAAPAGGPARTSDRATVVVDLEPKAPHVTVDSGIGQRYRCRINAHGASTVDVLYPDGAVRSTHNMSQLEVAFARAAIARATSPLPAPPRYHANIHRPGEMAENPTGGYYRADDITPLLRELAELRAERDRHAAANTVPDAWRHTLITVLNAMADIQDTITNNAPALRLTAGDRRRLRHGKAFLRDTGTPLLRILNSQPKDSK